MDRHENGQGISPLNNGALRWWQLFEGEGTHFGVDQQHLYVPLLYKPRPVENATERKIDLVPKTSRHQDIATARRRPHVYRISAPIF
jgi:hypothetical protein